MGITGLYKWLDSIKRVEHVKKYNGLTLGIDTYSWLHKGAFSCALELVQGTPTTRYVDFCVERIKMLQYHGVTPYLVFDGDYLPSKAGTEAGREERREESRQKGLELLKTNKKEAMDILQKAVDVTPAMARAVIQACKELGVQYVVAPYEADAQLYYLEKIGVIDGVISEDSDLLVFGVRLLVTKMDRFGDCVEVNRADFTKNRDITLAGWTDAEFRMMAILSGCDYLPSIRGIGLKKAHGYVRSHKTVDRIVRAIRMEGRMTVPPDYLEKFKQAELTFLHQRVWCPKAEMMVMCNEPDEPLTGEALVFIGGVVEPQIARGIALGELDPITKLPFDPIPTTTHTARAYPSQPCITFRPRPRPPAAKPVSIAAFFPKTSTPRTPLAAKSSNIQAIRKAFTAPRPSSASSSSSSSFSCPPKKRGAEEAPNPDTPIKKSRTLAADENVRVTGERSAFFNTPKHLQSRRPLAVTVETPTTKKTVTESAPIPPTVADSDLEKAIQASLQPEYLPDTEIETGVQKVARSLKADFSKSGHGKLAKFVEKQRVGAAKARLSTSAAGIKKNGGFMQQFKRSVGTKMQIPHTVGVGEESQDSAGGDSQGAGLGLGVGVEESQGSDIESQREFGRGLEAFRLKR
ncbi:PIN domain-like protein [Morchella conica CCBAS932]|uniref:PIN domain-like protein n=1 Tax=Morchella conica CCBAS932 TaxID=1392247 RepID=A0A3N4KSV0_9PEZI|nr:PIN domain-like protein [Morchella conica CCBAS932]